MVDAEHFAFVGRGAEPVGTPTGLTEAMRVEWVPLELVPDLINADEVWDAGSLLALTRVLLNARG